MERDPNEELSIYPSSKSVQDFALSSTKRIKQERLLVQVDLSNLYDGHNRLGVKSISHSKLLDIIVGNRWVSSGRIIGYGGIHKENIGFIGSLNAIGVSVITKPAYPDQKCNFDVELAVDAIELAWEIDTIALVSGDGDFTYLVHALQKAGKKVEVYGFSPNMSASLKNAADHCRILDDILSTISTDKDRK